MSAPHSPGGVTRVSASRSQAAMTSGALLVREVGERRELLGRRQPAVGAGVCTTTANASVSRARRASRSSATHDLDAERARPGSGRRRWSAAGCRRRAAARCPVLVGPAGQGHRLGDRGGLVEQARAGGRQPGQVADHGLEVEQRLEPALADLGLVRRVRGVPGRVLEHVAADHRRGDGAVVAEADHGAARVVPGGEVAQRGQRLGLGEGGRQVQRSRIRIPPAGLATRSSSEPRPRAASILSRSSARARCAGRRRRWLRSQQCSERATSAAPGRCCAGRATADLIPLCRPGSGRLADVWVPERFPLAPRLQID